MKWEPTPGLFFYSSQHHWCLLRGRGGEEDWGCSQHLLSGLWTSVRALPEVGKFSPYTLLTCLISFKLPPSVPPTPHFCLSSRIMMCSVLRHTKTPVKFWFLKNYLSPSFKVMTLLASISNCQCISLVGCRCGGHPNPNSSRWFRKALALCPESYTDPHLPQKIIKEVLIRTLHRQV